VLKIGESRTNFPYEIKKNEELHAQVKANQGTIDIYSCKLFASLVFQFKDYFISLLCTASVALSIMQPSTLLPVPDRII
jgi:hypothetical protein